MMAQVIIDKAGNEVVAVVVARLDAQRQRVPDSVRSGTQRLRLELAVHEVIAVALVHQQR